MDKAKILKVMKKSFYIMLTAYFLYAIIFGVVIFSVHQPETPKTQVAVSDFQKNTGDRITLLEEGEFAGIARINIIENAQETIDIAYHAIHPGFSANLLFSSILEAADRGVQIRVILDGMFHNLRGREKTILYSFKAHPNITIKFYEPFKLLQPWTWNNRLHDKLMIVDRQYAIIGGRNIGDRYFGEDEKGKIKNDRDVMIFHPNTNQKSNSVIYEMTTYFNELWAHHFSEDPIKKLTSRKKEKALVKTQYMRKNLEWKKERYPHLFNQTIDWMEMSIPANDITFIHNPLQRLNKQPDVWYELTKQMKRSHHSLMVESPYIIPTKKMLHYINEDEFLFIPKDTFFYTNSTSSTSNPLAHSGYLRKVDKILSKNIQIIEYEGSGSIHSKTFIFDERISAIGSFNFDPRSTFLSTESVVLIDSEEFANLLIDKMNKTYEKKTFSHYDEQINDLSYKPFLLKVLSLVTTFFQHLL